MTRIRSFLATAVLVLAVPALVVGCGGDDESTDVDPQTVLDETFSNDERISSGDLTLSLEGSAEGDQGGSFEASLSGPFQGDPENANAIPQLDWTGSLSFEGGGQSFSGEGALIVTEDNAFVEYGGSAYEVGTEAFAQFQQLTEQAAAQQSESAEGLSVGEAFRQGCEQQIQTVGGDPAACDVDFAGWLTDLTNEGEEEIEGASTVHISGALEVETMLQDIFEIAEAVPQSSGTLPTDEQVQQVADAITEASFDLYSGTEDRLIRGLDFTLAIDPSSIPDAEASGVDSVDAGFSMRLAGVNEEQTIEAPSDAQPIEDLLGQFGIDPSALGGLGGLGGLGAGAAPGGGGGDGAPLPGGGDPDAYLDCIAEAVTPEEIEACASSL